jgi:hypothetical protein
VAASGSNRCSTLGGVPAVDTLVGELLDRLARATEVIPGLEALVVGGSVGRGEAVAQQVDGGIRLVSDIEAYLVGSSRSLRDDAKRLSEQLSTETGTDFSVAWLDSRRLRRGAGKNLSFRRSPTLHQYELLETGRVLRGEWPRVQRFEAAELPLAEGVRLILNRLIEATPHVIDRSAAMPFWLDKVLVACGAAMLIAESDYEPSQRRQWQRLQEVLPVVGPHWQLDLELQALILGAYARRLGESGRPAPDRHSVAAVAGGALREVVRRDLGLVFGAWTEFPVSFAKGASRSKAYLQYLPPFGPAAQYEAFVVLARLARSSAHLTSRAFVQAVHGRPLSLIALGAGAPAFFAALGASEAGEMRPEDSARLWDAVRGAMDAGGVPIPGELRAGATALVARWRAAV